MSNRHSTFALAVVMLQLGCAGSPTNTPEAAARAAFSNPLGASPNLAHVLFSDNWSGWAFLIAADAAPPHRSLARVSLITVKTNEGWVWTVNDAMLFSIENKELVFTSAKFGSDLAQKRSEDLPLSDSIKKKWDAKWSDYLQAQGYTLRRKD